MLLTQIVTYSNVTYSNVTYSNVTYSNVTYSNIIYLSTNIYLDKPLSPGEAVIKFKYVGNLNDQMKGFYRAKYFVNGEER